ncbi:MAG: patatin-like phospholipase family protein [Anaerolineae bacterium]|nr:patatin-like phospholipase family protein [Anaerolineae bacterium]
MAEKLNRPRVGLALGGGVVRGMAHVGVLEVLLGAGIPIDIVAGTSVGAVIGAVFAAGRDVAEIAYIVRKIRWRDIARPVWPRRGLLSFAPLERTLVRLLGVLTFAQLTHPFAAVCTDMRTGRQVVISEGRVAPAVRASASVPGIVTPLEVGPYLLADGAIVNNTPASVVREMGADYVIGVDIMAPDFLRAAGPLGLGFMALEIAIANSGTGRAYSEVFISPQLGGLTYILFSERETLIEHGREAATAAIPEIRHALGLEPV